MKQDAPITFKAIRQPSVVELIIDNVANALMRGELKAGDRLPSEMELAQQLGAGRSAVREAMKVLEALGVIDIRRGNGTYIVDSPSPALLSPLVFAIMLEANDTEELFELRRLIEIGYCELTAQKANSTDWLKIEGAAKTLEDYIERGEHNIDQLVRLDLEFHFAVLDATHNPLVIKIGRAVEELFFASIRNTYVSREDNMRWAIVSHRNIISAMREGEPETIRLAIERSLLYWKEEV